MADGRGARNGAASRNGGGGAGPVELDWVEDPNTGILEQTQVTENKNIYGGKL